MVMLRRRTLLRARTLALLLAGTGCIPHHRNVPLSPPLVGTIRYADDTPAPGMVVTVDDRVSRARCRNPTRWATTDRMGRFSFPEISVPRDWVLIIPYDAAFTVFDVCVGRDSASLALAFTGRGPLTGGAPADSVRCILWSVRGQSRQSCASPSRCFQHGSSDHPRQLCTRMMDPSLHESGAWETPSARGFYRLLVPLEESRAQEAMVQWVQRLDDGAPRVVDSLVIPLAPHLWRLGPAELRTDSARTCVLVLSTGHREHWYHLNPRMSRTSLELGPPGHAAPSAACDRT
jgi:hypothetical protein